MPSIMEVESKGFGILLDKAAETSERQTITQRNDIAELMKIIRAYRTLAGYTKSATSQAIKDIRNTDYPTNDVRDMMIQRAEELDEALEIVLDDLDTA